MMYVLQGLLRDTLIEDDKGKRMEAMKVFSAAIGYLRNHLLSTCKNQLTSIEDSDIKWVLTVPAIWTDPSKQFMREAAEKVRFLYFYPYKRNDTVVQFIIPHCQDSSTTLLLLSQK